MMSLSALPIGRLAGMWPLIASVCRKSRPAAVSAACRARAIPASIGPAAPFTISSMERLAWRALRATSDMPFLLLSSSSSVFIGTKMSCSSNRNRLAGSCISTLVSSTNSLVRVWRASRRARRGLALTVALSAWAGGDSERLNKVEYLLGMAGNLDAAPLAADCAPGVEHERAALDAAHLLAVHLLHLDHAELLAGFLVLVCEQLERELHLRLEVLVRLQAVARHAVPLPAG